MTGAMAVCSMIIEKHRTNNRGNSTMATHSMIWGNDRSNEKAFMDSLDTERRVCRNLNQQQQDIANGIHRIRDKEFP